jgi:putative hydrolase of the HAD superfamily
MSLAGDRIELVFFDVAETLVRPDPSWADVYLGASRSYGLTIEREPLAQALSEVMRDGAWSFEGPFEATPEASYQRIRAFDAEVFGRLGHADLPDGFFRRIEQAFAARESWHVYPDVVPALDALAAAGIRRAVISNFTWGAPELLHELDLASRFEALVISARVGYQKPHQGIFRHALEVTGVAPQQAVHVGDSYRGDALGAAAVGIRPIVIARDGPAAIEADETAQPAEVPEIPVIRDLLELVDLLGVERLAARSA